VPSCLIRHRRTTPHLDSTVKQSFVDALVNNYNLHLTDYFEDPPSTPVPGIRWEEGYTCIESGCSKACSSMQNMKRHMSSEHGIIRTPPPKSLVQAIFESNTQRYPVTGSLAPSTQLRSSSESHTIPLHIILTQYSTQLEAAQSCEVLDDPAILNPFLAKYRWQDVLKDESVKKVRDWVSLPPPSPSHNQDFIFEELARAVKSYYKKICKEMECLDVNCHTTTLRWINSTKEYVFVNK
jgi:orsellinic acid/F9775 biosynthesis protein OrsD